MNPPQVYMCSTLGSAKEEMKDSNHLKKRRHVQPLFTPGF